MKLKTSYFNKTIFKKNLTHFWPLWVCYTIYLIWLLPFRLWMRIADYKMMEMQESIRQINIMSDVVNDALQLQGLLVFAALSVVVVFSYLYSAKNTNMIHSLPVNRLELFVTNFSSAAVFMLLPELLTFIIAIFVCLAAHITKIEYILFWFGSFVGITFFELALGVFVAMFTGQSIAFLLYDVIVNYFYVGCTYLWNMLVQKICFGVDFSWKPGKMSVLSPIYYLSANLCVEKIWDEQDELIGLHSVGGHFVIFYVLAGVVCLFFAYHVYKRRNLETAGDLLSIKSMKPIFRFGVGTCCGLTFGVLLSEIITYQSMGTNQEFYFLVASVVALETLSFFVAEMFLCKSFHIFRKKRMVEWASLTVVIVALLGMIKTDVFGIERKVPNLSEVVKASVDLDYNLVYSGEEIQKVIDIHQAVLAQKESLLKEDASAFQDYCYMQLKYDLKDGTVLKRRYPIPITEQYLENEDSFVSQVIALERETDNLLSNLFGKYYETNEYYAGSIEFVDEIGRTDEYRFSKEELQKIMDAIVKDIKDGNLDEEQIYTLRAYEMKQEGKLNRYYNSVMVNFYNPNKIIWGNEETDSYSYYETSSQAYLQFSSKAVHLIETLKTLGIVNEERKLITTEEYENLMGVIYTDSIAH